MTHDEHLDLQWTQIALFAEMLTTKRLLLELEQREATRNALRLVTFQPEQKPVPIDAPFGSGSEKKL